MGGRTGLGCFPDRHRDRVAEHKWSDLSISYKADFKTTCQSHSPGICRYNPGSGFAPIALAGLNPSHALH
jgi:hypothetical protein